MGIYRCSRYPAVRNIVAAAVAVALTMAVAAVLSVRYVVMRENKNEKKNKTENSQGRPFKSRSSPVGSRDGGLWNREKKTNKKTSGKKTLRRGRWNNHNNNNNNSIIEILCRFGKRFRRRRGRSAGVGILQKNEKNKHLRSTHPDGDGLTRRPPGRFRNDVPDGRVPTTVRPTIAHARAQQVRRHNVFIHARKGGVFQNVILVFCF